MRRLTTKDVQGFGRVLEAIGQLLQERPESLLDVVQANEATDERDHSDMSPDLAKVDAFSLFDVAKTSDQAVLEERLNEFSLEELRILLRRYHLGAPKRLRTKEQVVRFIAEQALKRSVDVFRKTDDNTGSKSEPDK